MSASHSVTLRAASLVACAALALGCQGVKRLCECQLIVGVANEGLTQLREAEQLAPPARYDAMTAALESTVRRLRETELHDTELSERFTLVRETLLDTSTKVAQYRTLVADLTEREANGRDVKRTEQRLNELDNSLRRAVKAHESHVRRVKALCSPRAH